ncbi:MAG: hypothetical protein JXR83_20120 [Deltaproteobacteria bacterium]|nr:hypothetical protein [Deltaproteobacteria bacterium]
MKAKIATLSVLGAAVLATAAAYDGCFGEPCPDLYIACPDLECPQGFKVNKSGCAICECVGDVDQIAECYSDADCQAGEYCDFGARYYDEPTAGPCYGGYDGAEYCGVPQSVGECRPIETTPCAGLDEWSCIETAGCEPVYDSVCMRCEDEERCGDAACLVQFIECVAGPIDRCWGAWIDSSGQCRSPDGGFYPAECCGLDGCWSDADCPAGYVCAQALYGGEAPGASDAMIAPAGQCVPATFECYSDADCSEGYFCALPPVDCGAPVDGDGDGVIDEGDLPVDCIVTGVCVPIEQPDPCAGLDEEVCAATTGCQAIYGPCQPCDCLSDDPTCEACETWRECGYLGCEAIPLPTLCFSDEECGAGMVCSFDSMTNCGGERVDGDQAPVNCGGICVPA